MTKTTSIQFRKWHHSPVWKWSCAFRQDRVEIVLFTDSCKHGGRCKYCSWNNFTFSHLWRHVSRLLYNHFYLLDTLHVSWQLPCIQGSDLCQVQRSPGHPGQGLRVRRDQQEARVPQQVSSGQGSSLRRFWWSPADRVQCYCILCCQWRAARWIRCSCKSSGEKIIQSHSSWWFIFTDLYWKILKQLEIWFVEC